MARIKLLDQTLVLFLIFWRPPILFYHSEWLLRLNHALVHAIKVEREHRKWQSPECCISEFQRFSACLAGTLVLLREPPGMPFKLLSYCCASRWVNLQVSPSLIFFTTAGCCIAMAFPLLLCLRFSYLSLCGPSLCSLLCRSCSVSP